jgi:hypothetical protein
MKEINGKNYPNMELLNIIPEEQPSVKSVLNFIKVNGDSSLAFSQFLT